MYSNGEVIDGRYQVAGLCSDAGGMGTLLHILDLQAAPPYRQVLKYCKDTSDEHIKRFRREVRLLESYKGNSRVVQVESSNLNYDPPYFVMKYHDEGDLLAQSAKLRTSPSDLELTIIGMIDAVQELHSRNNFHRDIKPQNFLLDGGSVLVSDFGLTTEIGSKTAFTQSSAFWGTHGYIPPEFLTDGGFKNADAPGDVFMLGKTIYKIVSDRDPLYLLPADIPAPLYHVIERACSVQKAQRYQTLSELRQSITSAFDAILNRGGGVGNAKQKLLAISDRLASERKYVPENVKSFVEGLCLLESDEKVKVCDEIPTSFFGVIAQKSVSSSVDDFLSCYGEFVENQSYSWARAEGIADNMNVIFFAEDPSPSVRASALDLAVRAAKYMNRFAAMDTCRKMIRTVKDEAVGEKVALVIAAHKDSFIKDIEPIECHSLAVARALTLLRTK